MIGICLGCDEHALSTQRRQNAVRPIYTNLGNFHYFAGEFAKARQYFEQSVAIEPRPRTLSSLAKLAFDNEDYREAVARYKAALLLDNKLDKTWGSLGASYLQLGEEEKARQAYRTAIRLVSGPLKVNPDQEQLLASLAHYHASLGEHENAIPHVERAIELAPDDPNILIHAAETYMTLQRPDQAFRLTLRGLQGGYSVEAIKRSPTLQALFEHPNYQIPLEDAARKGRGH